MRIRSVCLFILTVLLLEAGRRLKEKSPRVYHQVVFYCLILCSAVSAGFWGLLLYAVYVELAGGASMIDKAFFTLLAGCLIAAWVFLVISAWRRWRRER